jgi:hypothetical protein
MPPRLRTIPQTILYFKTKDPETYVNETYLRGLINSGAIPYHRAGKRFLINLSVLEDYFDNPKANPEPVPTHGKIRQING